MSFSFFPQTVYRQESKISGLVEVKKQFGRYTLYVQGLIQSGGIIKGIWKKPLKKISETSRVLVLGLGGGTVVHLIKKRFPEAEIVGVEIDPEIIKVGKKFFGLGEVKGLKIVRDEAAKWVNDYQGKKFDLILVDLYLGSEFSKEASRRDFLSNLKGLLTKKGIVIFNQLRIKKTPLEGLEMKLKDNFPQVKRVRTVTNHFFLARDKRSEV